MSDTDRFIEEVSEEVRRDRLYAMFRRWGWVAGLVIVGIVGGAAWLEYSRSQEQAQAEAFGDSLIAALDRADPEARVTALEGITPASPEARIILTLLAAGEVARGGAEADRAAADLRMAAEAPDLPRRYRDLALLKAEMLAPSDPDAARLILSTLAEPGAPYAALAEEQLALLEIGSGQRDAGLDRLRALERSAAATPGLQQRASQLIVALEAGSTLADASAAPQPAQDAEAETGTPDAGAEDAPAGEAEAAAGDEAAGDE